MLFFIRIINKARADILKIHSKKMNLTRGIDLKKVAEKMIGASGAESKVILKKLIIKKLIILIKRLFVQKQVCLL